MKRILQNNYLTQYLYQQFLTSFYLSKCQNACYWQTPFSFYEMVTRALICQGHCISSIAISHTLSHFTLPVSLKGRHCYSHSVHESKGLEYSVTCPRVPSSKTEKPEFNPGPSTSQVYALIKCVLIDQSFQKGLLERHL